MKRRVLEKQCPMCGKTTYMIMSEDEYDKVISYLIYRKNQEKIQDALPIFDKFGREFIKTGYCPECQENLFEAKLPDKSKYFNCYDLDNEDMDAFLNVLKGTKAKDALLSDQAKSLSYVQKLFLIHEFELYDELVVDEDGNVRLVSEEE